MVSITEKEFANICASIHEERESIIKHNPIGTDKEILLWMLMSTLVLYLSLPDIETPCINGRADEATYRNAISFILEKRRLGDFAHEPYIDSLLKA